ncbi:ribosome hibernation-promoting factor, HPF/YfiA family [Brevibacillus sp. NPDC058079]|uniref:ribosome hibernation-promoting factor, HPF/YfiA family n=1 Tax=Brevibacillus sp. NPDC058079 TaxID=3346330 RepID=UPI0036E70789
MNVQLTARNFALTKGIKDAVNQRLEKLHKYLDDSNRIQVIMESFTHGQKIEIMFYLHGTFVKSEEKNEDLYIAIELATDKLVKKLNKLARKKADRSHDSLRFPYEAQIFTNNEDDDNEHAKITKRKQFDMKPMMEEEAILQMEMLGHETFMFFNAESNSMALLYKRKDGNFGIIESVY